MLLRERRHRPESLLSGNDALWFSPRRGRKRRGSVQACLRDGTRWRQALGFGCAYRRNFAEALASAVYLEHVG
jgi:hypothetical protein